jgi:gas vesicle protein
MANIKLDFTQRSWDKAKPKEIKGTKLTSALKDVEKAQAGVKKKGDPSALEECIKALQSAAAAADESMKKECDAKQHKDLVNALKKFNSDCQAEIKKLQQDMDKAAGEEDEDEDDEGGDILCPKLFKACIKKAKLKSSAADGISFCLGVHKKAIESRLVFRKKKGFAKQTFKQLLKASKENSDLGLQRPKMTYGAAFRDPNSKETLVLQILDGAPTDIPGMAVKLEKWRKKNKQELLPFKEISIRSPSGKALEMTPDPDEDEELVAGVETEAAQADDPTASARPQATGNQAAAAATASAAAAGAATPADGATAAAAPADEAAIDDRRKEFRKARRAWQTVKEQAIQDLEAVKDGIRDYYLDDPEQFKLATSKLGQLDAIMDNLNDDLRDVLDKYVSTPKTRQAELQQLGANATQIVQQFLNFANSDKLLNAVDQKEFADVSVKAPIEKALKDLVKTLG